MNRQEFERFMRDAKGRGYACVNSRSAILYPYFSIHRRKISFAVANVYTLSDSRGTFNVVIAMRRRSAKDGTPYHDISIWCSDQFLEGRSVSHGQALQRATEATAGMPNEEMLRKEMLGNYAMLPESHKCDFWKLMRGKPPQLCEHTEHVLADLFRPADIDELSAALEDYHSGMQSASTVEAAENILDSLMFRVPVLFEGDRGSGKTTEAYAFARQHDLPLIEFQGHEGVEATDLLGCYVPMADRSLVWKDGAVSQAFRHAARGQRTVLLIDELLRIPTRQQSVLLSAFAPIDGHYRVRTGRILNVEDGVGEEEMLRCKVEDLAVIATTNVGADYALDNIDPAVAERFMILRKDTTEETLYPILDKVVEAKGFDSATVARLVRFFSKAKEMRNAGQIARLPTTRTLVRAVELAKEPSEVGTMLINQALLWVERDLEGLPVKEQLESVKRLVSGIFPITTGQVLL